MSSILIESFPILLCFKRKMTLDKYFARLRESLVARGKGDEALEDSILNDLDKIWDSLTDWERGEVNRTISSGFLYPGPQGNPVE